MLALQAKILAPRIDTEFVLPPQYATHGPTGLDVRATRDKDTVIKLFETLLIPTGLSVYIGAPGRPTSSSQAGPANLEMEHFHR